MMKLRSLKTKIVTPRVDETRDWYRDLLGLVVLEEWNEPGDKGCILGIHPTGEAFLELHHSEESFDFGGLGLQFRVDDVSTLHVPEDERFAHSGPADRPWGSRYLFFKDPNGVSVVIFSGTSL
jgi:catechol 2,3-dioxygenase-like lactoylglutathione lyase family enzyme